MNNRLLAEAGNELIRTLLEAPYPAVLLSSCVRSFGVTEFVPHVKLQCMLVTLATDVVRYHGASCPTDLSPSMLLYVGFMFAHVIS